MSKFLAITILITTVALGHAQEDTSNSADMTNNVPEMRHRTRRVLLGTDTTIEAVPWQVALFRWRSDQWRHHCGGSIISEYWVVTAAHCVLEECTYMIRAGATNVNYGGSIHNITQTIRHPKYNTALPQINDIALIKVQCPFIMDKTRQAVPLFMENEILPVGSLVNISGWGLTHHSIYDFNLNIVQISILPMSECRRLYGRFVSGYDGFFCALDLENHISNSCKGDSGGPVTVNGRLVGLVSSGKLFCGTLGTPSLHTEIAPFRRWIKDTCNV